MQHDRAVTLVTGLFIILSAILLAVQVAAARVQPAPTPATAGLTGTPTPTVDRWQEIQLWTPYPHTTPLPPRVATPIDGAYVRFDPRTASHIPCRRCPPYPPEGGIWKLYLSEGIFRVYHPGTGWRTLGSYRVDGDQIAFFNDPQCHLAVGRFGWSLNARQLQFTPVEDNCELGTRAKNFTKQPWLSCQPPNREAAVTGHWSAPAGCE
jgi:hypothetical protein